MPRPLYKRGGRESNPQHPDRQSGTADHKPLSIRGLTPSPDSVTAVETATGSDALFDPDLKRLIDAWPTLSPAIRAGIAAMVGASCATKETDHDS